MASAVAAGVNVHCRGHLLKPGRIIRSNRKRRYFELVGHNLYYFASHAVAARGIGAAKGFDSLLGLQSVMLGDPVGATVPIHLVLADDSEAVYYVQQGSVEESFGDAKRWITAFTQLVPKKIKSVIQGELEHSLDRGQTWTRRFVMLLPDELVLFENEAATQRYSADPLACAVARLKFTDEFFTADAPGGSHQNSFQVCDFETSYYLAAPDPQLKMFWMLAISRIIEKMLETAAEITRRSFTGARILAQNPISSHVEAEEQKAQQAARDRVASEHMILGNKPRGRLLYDFEAENDGEISVAAGEIITLLERADEDFWIAQTGELRGFVQADYVEVLQSAPETSKPKRKARPPPTVPSRHNKPVGFAGEPATPRGSEHFGAPPPSLMDKLSAKPKGAPPPVPSRAGKPKAAPPVPSRAGKPALQEDGGEGSSKVLLHKESVGSVARRNRIAALSQRRVEIEERQRQEAIKREQERKEAAERKRQEDARAMREKEEAERLRREEEARLEKERLELEATRAQERALAEEQRRAREQALAEEERQRLETAKAELERQRRKQEEKLARERARVEADRKRAAEEMARKKAAVEAERRAEEERKQAERKKAAERRAEEEREAERLKAEEERLAREQEKEAQAKRAAQAMPALSPSSRPKGPAPARPSRNRRKSNVVSKPAMVRASESKVSAGGDSASSASASKLPAPKRRAQKKAGGIAARMAMWNKRANDYQEGQESNVFSASYKGGGGKISKKDAGYGQAKAGSKTEARANAAKEWCVRIYLCFSLLFCSH